MTFDELLAKYEPAHAAAFRQAIEEIKSGIVLRVVVERLERGDINSAIEAMHLEPEAFSALEVALTEALNAGGINAVGELPNLSEPNGARVIWRFGIRNPVAEAILRELRQAQPPGFSGPVPISNREIAAWCQLTGNIVRREEVSLVRAMDARFCTEIEAETEAIRAREVN